MAPALPTPAVSAQSVSKLGVSALGRPLDLNYPSNRLALYGAGGAILLGLVLKRSWRQALGIGGAAFLGWATARELDPDYPDTAALALGLAGAASVIASFEHTEQAQAVLPGFAALSSVRLLVGTVGPVPTLPDAAALSVQGGLAAFAGTRSAALMPAAALGLSSGQHDVLSPEGSWSLVALAGGLLPWKRAERHRRSIVGDVLSLAALGLGTRLTALETPISDCDQAPRKVAASRLRSGRALSLGALALGVVRGEADSLIPLAAAALGTGLRRFRNERAD
ncbi:hypothetical protein MF271_18230 (plasmid) [Deinococcus sp. KNUC1210]|uniref:hypothetical protein n=1 Tax=Deinococcus sp. KNUC1210 TaxID=2917691 RepID=UPI001EF0E7D0|nr:hypothetical protein [Deinococcus sp. KNUC1210]ULH17296.1 hypothetical protein MF271_18230 [Deinococcus sp. KNUC1210]